MRMFGLGILACVLVFSVGGSGLSCSPLANVDGALVSAQAPTAPPPQEPAQQPKPELTPRQAEEMRGDVMMARKQYNEAIIIYQKLIVKEPRNAVLLNKVGIAYHQLLLLDQAKRYYERAIKADKTFVNPVNNLGTVHYHRQKHRKAIELYKKALTINPNMAAVHSNLGYAYYSRKQYEEALASFRRAIELDPAILETRSSTGSLLQDRSVTDRPFFYFFLAKTYAMQGNAERCAYYLKKARDEGYKNLAKAVKDPAFDKVIQDPLVQEVLNPPAAALPPNPPGE